MQRLEVSGAVRLIYRSLGVKGLTVKIIKRKNILTIFIAVYSRVFLLIFSLLKLKA